MTTETLSELAALSPEAKAKLLAMIAILDELRYRVNMIDRDACRLVDEMREMLSEKEKV